MGAVAQRDAWDQRLNHAIFVPLLQGVLDASSTSSNVALTADGCRNPRKQGQSDIIDPGPTSAPKKHVGVRCGTVR